MQISLDCVGIIWTEIRDCAEQVELLAPLLDWTKKSLCSKLNEEIYLIKLKMTREVLGINEISITL